MKQTQKLKLTSTSPVISQLCLLWLQLTNCICFINTALSNTFFKVGNMFHEDVLHVHILICIVKYCYYFVVTVEVVLITCSVSLNVRMYVAVCIYTALCIWNSAY